MALVNFLACCYYFGAAWSFVTIAADNSSTVSLLYHNSTTTSQSTNTTASQPEIPSGRSDGKLLSSASNGLSGVASSERSRESGNGFLLTGVQDRDTTRPATTASQSMSHTIPNGTHAPNISTTGSGFDYASSCESYTREWLSASSDWFLTNKYSSIAVNTIVNTETLYSVDVIPVTTTSCLGLSRELGGQTLAQSPTGVDVSTMLHSYITSKAPPYPVSAPACKFATADCNLLWDEWDAYNSLAASVWPDVPTSTRVPEPFCNPDRPGAYCDKCVIQGNFANLHYWPMIAVGEPCDADRSFITATPTIPGKANTVVFGTNTFTSPTVYLSIDYLAAVATSDEHWNFCGQEFSSTFIPLMPEQVSTIRYSLIDNGNIYDYYTFDQGTTTEYETLTSKNFTIAATASLPVAFQDFMEAVPAAAWNAQYWNAYSTGVGLATDAVIIDAQYSPIIVLPQQVHSMDPLWSNCEVHLGGISDPPVALTAAKSILLPHLPTFTTTINVPGPSGTPAEPAGLPDTPHASATSTRDSQTRVGSSKGAAETGGPSQPGRTTSLVDLPPVNLPSGEISSSGSATQDPSSDPDDPRKDDPDSDSDIVPIVAGFSTIGSHEDEGQPKAQQSITRIAPSKQASMAITLNGSKRPLAQSGSVAVIGDQTLTIGGNAAVINGQQISLEPGGLRVASSETVNFPSLTTTTAATQRTVVWDDGNVSITAVQANGAVVLTSGATSISISFGDSGNLNGHIVAVPPGGGMIIVDGSEVLTLGETSSGNLSSGQLSLPAGGKKITAQKLGNNRVLLTSGSDTITLANGDKAIFAGAEVAILADGSGVVINSSSLIPWPASKESAEEPQSTSFSAIASGRYVLLAHGQSTVALGDGSVTVLDGHAISAARDGRDVVVDGSYTQVVEPSSTRFSEGEGRGGGQEASDDDDDDDDDTSDAVLASSASPRCRSSDGYVLEFWTWGILLCFALM